MSFNGFLNKTYIHQTRTLTVDGTGVQVETYTSAGTYPCRLDYFRLGEIALPERITTRVSNIMYCATNSALNEYDRVVINGQNYNVILVMDNGGNGHHAEILVERVEEGGI